MTLPQLHTSYRLLLAGALLAASAVLWLSTGASGRAATATQTQSSAVTVANTISWGSAGGCTQSMGTADFGTMAAGASAESTTFRGCVTSNARWSVAAQGTGTLTNAGESETIANSNLVVRSVTPLPSGATTSCNDTNTTCTMDASRNVISNANRQANSFDYKYRLSVPASAAGGSYTGGQVTLTASN